MSLKLIIVTASLIFLSETLCVRGQMERILCIVESFSHTLASQQSFFSLSGLQEYYFHDVLNHEVIEYLDFIWGFPPC